MPIIIAKDLVRPSLCFSLLSVQVSRLRPLHDRLRQAHFSSSAFLRASSPNFAFTASASACFFFFSIASFSAIALSFSFSFSFSLSPSLLPAAAFAALAFSSSFALSFAFSSSLTLSLTGSFPFSFALSSALSLSLSLALSLSLSFSLLLSLSFSFSFGFSSATGRLKCPLQVSLQDHDGPVRGCVTPARSPQWPLILTHGSASRSPTTTLVRSPSPCPSGMATEASDSAESSRMPRGVRADHPKESLRAPAPLSSPFSLLSFLPSWMTKTKTRKMTKRRRMMTAWAGPATLRRPDSR